jgi:hypothetical protein
MHPESPHNLLTTPAYLPTASCIMRSMTAPHLTTRILSFLRRMLELYVLLGLLVLSTGALMIVQANRSQLQPADAAIVMLAGQAAGDAARLAHAEHLFRTGHVARIVVAGRAPDVERARLGERVGAAAVVEVRAARQVAQLAGVRQVLEEQQLQRALLIAEPVGMLRLLKIARDAGLQPRSVPVGAEAEVSFFGTLLEIGRYFRYILWQG